MKEIIVCGAGRVFAFQIISATLGSSRVGRGREKKKSVNHWQSRSAARVSLTL